MILPKRSWRISHRNGELHECRRGFGCARSRSGSQFMREGQQNTRNWAAISRRLGGLTIAFRKLYRKEGSDGCATRDSKDYGTEIGTDVGERISGSRKIWAGADGC